MDCQEKVKKFNSNHNLSNAPMIAYLDFISESGELAKEFLKITNYGKDTLIVSNEIKDELGDVFYSFLCLANAFAKDWLIAFNPALLAAYAG